MDGAGTTVSETTTHSGTCPGFHLLYEKLPLDSIHI
jgi:hypothetical protein